MASVVVIVTKAKTIVWFKDTPLRMLSFHILFKVLHYYFFSFKGFC